MRPRTHTSRYLFLFLFCCSRSIGYTGAELDDDTVPSPKHDIFVLTRPAARAQAKVTFR